MVWSPSRETWAAGERARVRYLFAPDVPPGVQVPPSPALLALRDAVLHAWTGVSSGGTARPSDRRTGGHDPHLAGFAVDFMLAPGPARAVFGAALASWCVEHAEELGLQYVLHDRYEWSASHVGPRWEPYTGSDPHVDHVHVELGPDARAWSAEVMRAKVLAALSAPSWRAWVGPGVLALVLALGAVVVCRAEVSDGRG